MIPVAQVYTSASCRSFTPRLPRYATALVVDLALQAFSLRAAFAELLPAGELGLRLLHLYAAAGAQQASSARPRSRLETKCAPQILGEKLKVAHRALYIILHQIEGVLRWLCHTAAPQAVSDAARHPRILLHSCTSTCDPRPLNTSLILFWPAATCELLQHSC